MIESAWLRAFAVFSTTVNLSRAAKELHLSQPAVHAQLKQLAAAVGAPLYRRVGRGLALTREGIEVAAFARESEERSRELVARLSGEATASRIVLAAGAGAFLYVVGEGIAAFTRAHDARLELVTADAGAAVSAVASGVAHVGVAALDRPPEGLASRAILTVPQVLVVPRTHRLAKRSRVSLADLSDEGLVVPPEGREQRAMLAAMMQSANARLRVAAVASGWEVIIRFVELGAGVAVVNGSCRVPRSLVKLPLRELPKIHYRAFTREDARPLATALMHALAAHARRAA